MSDRTLEPKLRFPEYSAAKLFDVQLGDVTEEVSTRKHGHLPTTSVMGVSKSEGIVPMKERIVAADIGRYKVVRKDWFAYNPMRLNIGSIARWNGDADILVSPDYVVFKCIPSSAFGLVPAYLDHFRKSDLWSNFVSHVGDGGVRVRIYYKDLARLSICLPEPREQIKIADCLTSLDDLIAAENQKLDALRQHKQGLLQQLFPRPVRTENGETISAETIPELRFQEFNGGAGWSLKSMGDATIKTDKRNKGGRSLPVYSISNKTGFTPQNEQFQGMDSEERGYDISLYKLIDQNTFAYNPARINVGSIGYSGDLRDIMISSLYVCFVTKTGVDDQFLMHHMRSSQFEQTVRKKVEGGIRSYLFYENFQESSFHAPR